MSFLKKTLFACQFILLICLAKIAYADQFLVKKIQINGLQKISPATAMSYVPFKAGNFLDSAKTADIIRSLYKTGFFNSVNLVRDGENLIIKVAERAVIGEIKLEGNRKIETKNINAVLKNIGFTEGEPFDEALLANLKHGLLQQYNSLGYYNVVVDTKVSTIDNNRLLIKIQINEGAVAKIRRIRIVGNEHFSKSQVLANFTLTTWRLWSWITDSDKYSKEKLDFDLESLRNFYLDNGYLEFFVKKMDAHLSEDKKTVDITITIHEGEPFKISGWDLGGDLLGKEGEIRKMITLETGNTFSRATLLTINEAISKYVGNFGYALPSVEAVPQINVAKKQVFLKFNLNPGKQFYVNRINFSGNTKTHATVLRRELRQMEASIFSLAKVEESKRRLNNLGYLKDVEYALSPVANANDELDINYKIKETPTAGATGNIGYSDADGFIYSINFGEPNFLGSGKGVNAQFMHTRYESSLGFSYYDPYFTEHNVSMSLDAYSQRTRPAALNLTSYDTTAYGLSMSFGVPLSDYNRFNIGYGLEHLKVADNQYSSQTVQDFLQKYGNAFNTIKLTTGWIYSKLDRSIFPTRGLLSNLSLEAGLPTGSNSNLEYYKTNYTAVGYLPVSKYFILRSKGEAGYGDGYGKMKTLPFFKNYYCGGMDSVRGFEGSTLGPIDSSGKPLGGNLLTDASMGLIFPNPFMEVLRTTIFVDIGNVYQHRFLANELRSSAGLQAEWRTPFGVVSFSLAKPLRSQIGDQTTVFQFNLGTSF